MLKKAIVGGLAAIVIGATGVGAYDALQNGGTLDHTPRVEAAAYGAGNGYQGGAQDSAVANGTGVGRGTQNASGSQTNGRQGGRNNSAMTSGSGRGRDGQGAAGAQAATLTHLSSGATIQLHDPDGRPMWAGGRTK